MASTTPLYVASAEGALVEDADGNEYVDISGASGALLFGHNAPCVREALLRMLDSSEFALGFEHALVGSNARRLCRMVGLERATFVNTGTEATTLAARLARLHRGRSRIVCFEGSYHGHYDGFLGTPSSSAATLHECTPSSPGVSPAFIEDLVVLQYDDESALAYIIEHADEIAAVFVEPVQAQTSLANAPRAFLRKLRELTRSHGIVMVFDEVVTGFRIAAGGAQAHFGVRADLVTYGKALAGGLPIGAVAGSTKLMDGVDGGAWEYGDKSFPRTTRTYFAGTFCKFPLSSKLSRHSSAPPASHALPSASHALPLPLPLPLPPASASA